MTDSITFMLGAVRDDFVVVDSLVSGFMVRDPDKTREGTIKVLKELLGDAYDEGEAMYHFDCEGFAASLVEACKDYIIASMLAFAEARRRSGAAPTFVYDFTHVMPGPMSEMAGCFHSCEVPYFLGNLSDKRAEWWKPEDRVFAERMSGLVAAYAKCGTPAEDWRPTDGRNYYMIGDEGFREVTFPEEKWRFWRKLFLD